MTFAVLDTSAFIPLVLQGPLSAAAHALADQYRFLAPAHMFAEATNTLRRLVRAGDMTQQSAAASLRVLDSLVDERPVAPLTSDALELTRLLDHSAYDCVFAALARTVNVPLITADTRFVSKLRVSLPSLTVIDLHDEASREP